MSSSNTEERLPRQNTAVSLNLMQQSVLFKKLALPDLEAVLLTGSIKHFAQNSYLFHRDDPANTICILVEGTVHLSQITLKGQQIIMHYLSPGEEIGILALFPDQVYPVTAVAATDCTLLCWSADTFHSLILQYPQLALNALHMMTNRFVVLQNQFRQLATERAEQRIARTLLKIAQKSGKRNKHGIHLTPPPSRQQLAEMTGTTLYTVSRICSQWEKDGLVHTNRRRLYINQLATLEAIVEDAA